MDNLTSEDRVQCQSCESCARPASSRPIGSSVPVTTQTTPSAPARAPLRLVGQGIVFVDRLNSAYNNSFGSTVCNWVGGVLGSNLCRVLLATSVVHSGAYRTPSGCGYQRTNNRQHG
jgi:hypothetical protein